MEDLIKQQIEQEQWSEAWLVSKIASSTLGTYKNTVQGDPSARYKPPVDLDLGCFAIPPGQ